MSQNETYPEQRHMGRAMAWLSGILAVVSIVLLAYGLGLDRSNLSLLWFAAALVAAVVGLLTGLGAARRTAQVAWAVATFVATLMSATFLAIGLVEWLS